MKKELLLERISTEKNLHSAWKKLKKFNRKSHGISGTSIEDYGKNLNERIATISKRLKENSYRFSPTRAVALKKSNNKYRPLQVPEIDDRIVLKAIAIELEAQFDDLIKKSEGLSFAYQKKLGIRDAIVTMKNHYDAGSKTILEADIINFFGEVNKEILLDEFVFPELPDTSLNDLIRLALNQECQGIGLLPREKQKCFENIHNGIPQGNPLSPLLSNIYLSPFDIFMKSKGYKLIRYADDFIVMCWFAPL